MEIKMLLFAWALINFLFPPTDVPGNVQQEKPQLLVRKCADFKITGKGDHAEWDKTEWQLLNKLDSGGAEYETRFKILYSPTGIYVLFSGKDNKITTRFLKDFEDLYNGDVFEVFFHPDPALPLYFEYEINHLNKELVLLIPNFNGAISGWVPWQYEGARKVKKMVHVAGGKAEAGAAIQHWSAELFFPNELLRAFSSEVPKSKKIWNANFYRLDYDSGKMIKWAWSTVEKNFHEYEKFGAIRFE